MGKIKTILGTMAFCILFIPFLLIDLYHVATEVSEWERQGASK